MFPLMRKFEVLLCRAEDAIINQVILATAVEDCHMHGGMPLVELTLL
jgi:hypothetical protein